MLGILASILEGAFPGNEDNFLDSEEQRMDREAFEKWKTILSDRGIWT